jgi:hypothetical protein
MLAKTLTSTEVNGDIQQEAGVGNAVKHYPISAEVVVEESDGYWKYYDVGQQQEQHEKIPIKPEKN